MTHDLDLEIVRELHAPSGSETAHARERARAALMIEVAREVRAGAGRAGTFRGCFDSSLRRSLC